MSAAVALSVLLELGAAESRWLDPRDLELLAPELAHACAAASPTLAPHAADCVRILAVLWALETNHAFAPHPSARHACGPLQVVPVPGLTPPCGVLRWHVQTGLRSGLQIWRLKLRKAAGRVQRALEHYNGHPAYRAAYGRRGMRLINRVTPSGERCPQGRKEAKTCRT